MTHIGTFPFGQPVESLTQQDRTPKKVFVLGVYASAVHARWIGPDGKDVVKALAVASEPYIFWRGEGADRVIARTAIPKDLGTLVPADKKLNGPSGNALDDLFLGPMGFNRDDAWLCDLVPHSCMNPKQKAAIERARERFDFPLPTVPPVPNELASEVRRQEILGELRESQAPVLVLLGDQPIKWFLRNFDGRWKRLSDFPCYGQRHEVKLGGLEVDVLPLVHPRQIGRLGLHSEVWARKHEEWIDRQRRSRLPSA